MAGPNLQQTCSEDLEEEQVQTYGEDSWQKDRQKLVSVSFSFYVFWVWFVFSDGGAVAISLFNRDNNDSDQEQEEIERLKTERDERIQKNKEWRQRWVPHLNISGHSSIITDMCCRRHGVKNGTSTKEQLIVDKDARNEQIQTMLVCVNCG